MDGEAGAAEEAGQFDHAEAGEELFDQVGFLIGQAVCAEQAAEGLAVRAGVIAGQMVGGEGIEVLVRVAAGCSVVGVFVVEPFKGHGGHSGHVLGAATTLKAGRGLALAADQGTIFAHSRVSQVLAALAGGCYALALEGGDSFFNGGYVIASRGWRSVGLADGLEVNHGWRA